MDHQGVLLEVHTYYYQVVLRDHFQGVHQVPCGLVALQQALGLLEVQKHVKLVVQMFQKEDLDKSL